MSTDKLPTCHFERMNDGGMRLSPAAWQIVHYVMVSTEYTLNGPMGKLSTPDYIEEEILKLRQMFIDDGNDIEVLT